jgi:hypothetical protein
MQARTERSLDEVIARSHDNGLKWARDVMRHGNAGLRRAA